MRIVAEGKSPFYLLIIDFFSISLFFNYRKYFLIFLWLIKHEKIKIIFFPWNFVFKMKIITKLFLVFLYLEKKDNKNKTRAFGIFTIKKIKVLFKILLIKGKEIKSFW